MDELKEEEGKRWEGVGGEVGKEGGQGLELRSHSVTMGGEREGRKREGRMSKCMLKRWSGINCPFFTSFLFCLHTYLAIPIMCPWT